MTEPSVSMTTKQLQEALTERNIPWRKTWNKAQLLAAFENPPETGEEDEEEDRVPFGTTDADDDEDAVEVDEPVVNEADVVVPEETPAKAPEKIDYAPYTKEQLHAMLVRRGVTFGAKSWDKPHLIQQLEALDRGEKPIRQEQKKAAESVEQLVAQLKETKDKKLKKQIRTKLRRLGHYQSRVGK